MLLVVCGERWTGRREISDLRIELRLFHTCLRFFGGTHQKGQLFPMTQGTPVNVCRNRWLIVIFNISRRRISVLRDVCEESTFFCVSASARQLHRYCYLHLLSSFTRRAAPALTFRSYNEDLTLSRRTVGMPKADELKDITRLLASLWEAAQRLPEGSERQDAFRQIGSFHTRVAALISRAL